VNCPFKSRNYQRDGPGCVNDNQAGAPNYFPNSFSGPLNDRAHLESTYETTGDVKRHESGHEDNFSQVGVFWRKVLKEEERARLVENISTHLINAAEFIQQRAVENFSKCDEEYGRRLREALDNLRKGKGIGSVSSA
jgi:catalase